MTVLYLAQQKSSILSQAGSLHFNSNIFFWSSMSSMTTVVRFYLFPSFLPSYGTFFCCFTYLWCAVIELLTKAELSSFSLQLQQKEMTFHVSSLLRKMPHILQVKGSSAFGYALVLVSNSDLKYACTLGMQITGTASSSSTQSDEALIWAVERTKFTSKSPKNTWWFLIITSLLTSCMLNLRLHFACSDVVRIGHEERLSLPFCL